MSKNKRKNKKAKKNTDELCEKVADLSLDQGNTPKDEELTEEMSQLILVEETSIPESSQSEGSDDDSTVFVDDETIKKLVDEIFSGNPKFQFKSIQGIWKLLNQGTPPIDVFIEAGIVPRCIQFLEPGTNPALQYKAVWILGIIASGTSAHTDVVVKGGAVDPLMELVQSPPPLTNIVEKAIWALQFIAIEGPDLRDLLVSKGIVLSLMALVKSTDSPILLLNSATVLTNLCKINNPPPSSEVRQCLPALAKLIQMSEKKIVSEACWAISYLSEGSNEDIEEIVNSGVIERLVNLLDSTIDEVLSPSLRAVGNIVTGNDKEAKVAIDCGVLPQLAKLLKSSKANVVKEAAWTVSSIAAGNFEMINCVVDAGLVPLLIDVLRTRNFAAQQEAAWAIANITLGGSIDHKFVLFENGAISAICDLLTNRQNWRTIMAVFYGLENMFVAEDKSDQKEKVAVAVLECGGLHKIEALLAHPNGVVQRKAETVIDKLFPK